MYVGASFAAKSLSDMDPGIHVAAPTQGPSMGFAPAFVYYCATMRTTPRFLVLALLVPLAVQAANPTIAVMDFSSNNTSAGDASVLSELVREAVINSGAFTVVDKKNMD